MNVYADILIIINTVVDYFLLLGVRKIYHDKVKRKRLVFGALAGGVSSLIIFLPSLSFIAEILLRTVIAALMSAAAFGFKSLSYFLRRVITLFIITVCYAGAMIAALELFPRLPVSASNGVIYINISPLLLIALTSVCYFTAWLVGRTGRVTQGNEKHTVEIVAFGKYIKLVGTVDSGNSLRDPVDGTPVAVVTVKSIRTILPEKVLAAAEDLSALENAQSFHLRIVPAVSVGGKSLVVAVEPAEVYIDGYTAPCKILLGLFSGSFGDDVQILLPPGLELINTDKRGKIDEQTSQPAETPAYTASKNLLHKRSGNSSAATHSEGRTGHNRTFEGKP